MTARQRTGSDRGDVGDAAGARVQHLDLADQVAGPERQRAAGPLDANRPVEHEQQRVAGVADAA